MDTSLHVAISGQIAQQKRMDTVAQNIANATTTGYRRDAVQFDAILSNTNSDTSVAYASRGQTIISRSQGAVVKTDNPLDIAVRGDAWLSYLAPEGQVFTRDGRMQITAAGELMTITGHQILDAGGGPLQLDPNGGPPLIAADGTITQNGRQLGAIGLFTIPNNAHLSRAADSGVIPDVPAEASLDFGKNSVIQGHLENANIHPVLEMTRLIEIQRTFDALSSAIGDNSSLSKEAVRILGTGS